MPREINAFSPPRRRPGGPAADRPRPMTHDHRLFEKVSRASPAEMEAFFLRLRREKHFLERVFNALTEGVVVTTPDLRVLAANDRARELLGLGADRRVQGMRFPELVPFAELRRLLLRLDKEPGGLREEVQVGAPGGKGPFTLAVSIVPLAAAEQARAGFLIALEDTTEHRLLEQEKRHAEKLASLATLTAGVAHEIKNPLNSMAIHAQLLEKMLERAEEEDGLIAVETVRESLAVVLEEIGRLNSMVNEFLQAVRPTVPWMEPKTLNDLLFRVADLIRPDCERQGIDLRVLPDADLGLVQFDERQLSRAILNLLNNAYDAVLERREKWREEEAPGRASPQPPARIILRSRLRGDHALIEVADNGAGIPTELASRIFEPYFTTKFHGTGLGLMNVLRIVEEHGGKVHVETNVGEGTCFSLSIPVRAPLPVRQLEQSRAAAGEDGAPATPPRGDRPPA